MYIRRHAENYLKKVAQVYPIITVTGPRQSGKTTLVKELFPAHKYVSLESPDVLLFAKEDPRGFLNLGKECMILDEVQRFPEILSYIQTYVDEFKIMGQFILTGSAQFQLLQSITQSLAGRTAMLSLLPLSLTELRESTTNCIQESLDSILLKGFYPALFERNLESTDFYRNYVLSFVERDVRQILNISSLSDFQKFLRLLAGRVGQLVNYASLATEVGVSQPTMKHWFSVLEASFLISKISPYFENFGKRLVKTSKIYFLDTGLLCYLLGIETETQLMRDPLRGQIFENLIVTELIKSRWNQGKEHHLYFFRDNHGHEVDLLFQQGHLLTAIEIKSSQTWSSQFVEGLDYFTGLALKRVQKTCVVYGAKETQPKFHETELFSYLDAHHAIT